MSHHYRAFSPVLFVAASLVSSSLAAAPISDPLGFFEGRTESVSTIKVMMKKPYESRSVGHGEIAPDGSLILMQHVEEDGRPPHDRRWHMRKTGPGHFKGTMSDAKGPVTVDQIGGRYRFRFKMKDGVSIEQWVTPIASGKAARNTLTIKKFGIKVGSSEGTIRKLP
jgi:hypothetical protein